MTYRESSWGEASRQVKGTRGEERKGNEEARKRGHFVLGDVASRYWSFAREHKGQIRLV
jgi:hypothetical protein